MPASSFDKMDLCGYKINPRALLTSPNVLFRGVSVVSRFRFDDACLKVFCIIILACVDRDGYFAGRCMFYSGGSACSFALAVTSLGLIFCLIYMAVDVGFLSLPQKYRRYITIFELGFSGKPS